VLDKLDKLDDQTAGDVDANDVPVSVDAATGAVMANGVDKTMFSLSKRLLTSEALAAIGKLDREVTAMLKEYSVPSYFRPGIRLVKKAITPLLVDKLKAYKAQRAPLVDAFIAELPGAIADAEKALGPKFNLLDYPTPDEMRQLFGFSWRVLQLGTPTDLKEVDPAAFAEQQAALKAEVHGAALEIRALAMTAFAKVVGHLHERLAGVNAKGKKNIIHESNLDNVLHFCDTFGMRDITNHVQLKGLIDEAKALVGGVDVDSLRDDAAVRATVAEGVEKIKTTLDGMIVSQVRSIMVDNPAPTPAAKAVMAKARAKAAAATAA
jgi:hypothetical protein